MAIERRIEIDYGLRQVQNPRPTLRRPRRGEYKVAQTTGRPSERQQLQRLLDAAARPGRNLTEFLAELDRQGVAVAPRILASGRITGITYRRGDYEFSGSGLGAAFTWPGLLSRRRLDFVPERDLPALFAAAERHRRLPPRPADSTDTANSNESADPTPPIDTAPPAGPPFHPALPSPRPLHGAASAAGAAPPPAPRLALSTPDQEPSMPDDPTPPVTAIPPIPAGASAPSQPAAAPPPPTPASPGHRDQRARTADQVAAQLAALACPRFDVLVLDAATGAHRHLRSAWTPDQILASHTLAWLQHQNAQGGEILVRPAAPAGITLFEGVAATRLAAATDDGYEPAAVVRAHDSTREVWMRGQTDVPPVVQQIIDAELARVLAASRPVHTPGYGHLAGFTSPLAQRTAGLARPPFLALDRATGHVYRRFFLLARDSRDQAAREDLERRIFPELQAIADTPGAATTRGPRRHTAAQVAALQQIRDDADRAAESLGLTNPYTSDGSALVAQFHLLDHARESLAFARREHEAASGASQAQAETRLVESFRSFEIERQELSDRLGLLDVPADLPLTAAHNLARWRNSLDQAVHTLDRLATDPEAPPNELHEAVVTVRTLHEELTDAIRQHGLIPAPQLAAVFLAGAPDPHRRGDSLAPFLAAAAPAADPPIPAPTSAPPAAGHPPTPPPADRAPNDVSMPRDVPSALPPAQPAAAPLDLRESQPQHATIPPPSSAAAPDISTLPDDLLLAAHDTAVRAAAAREPAATSPGARSTVASPSTLHLAAEMALDEREIAVRSHLHEAIRAYERASLDLESLEPRLLREPTSRRAAAYDALLSRLAALEASQLALEQRSLRLAGHRLGRDLARLEQTLAAAPTDRLVKHYVELLDERRRIAPRLSPPAAGMAQDTAADPSHDAATTAPRAAPPLADPDAVQEAAVFLAVARNAVIVQPSPKTVQRLATAFAEHRDREDAAAAHVAAQELRTSRNEARLAAERYVLHATSAQPETAAAAPDVHLGRWRRALTRYQAAEARLAARLDAAEPPDPTLPGQLAQLRERIRRGDLSPDTLSRLQRVLTHLTRPADALAAPPPPGAPRPDRDAPLPGGDLAAAIGAWRAARSLLRDHDRLLPADPSPAQLDALRQAVSDVQSATTDLDRLSFAPATGRRAGRRDLSTLPPRYFLDHPAFTGAAHRATASWSAHASERGANQERIAQALPRARQSKLAAPRSLSSPYALAIATSVARVLWHHYTQEP